MISVRDVTVSFGHQTVLDKLSLDIFQGEVLVFIGRPARRSLMRTILGLNKKQTGDIEFSGAISTS